MLKLKDAKRILKASGKELSDEDTIALLEKLYEMANIAIDEKILDDDKFRK